MLNWCFSFIGGDGFGVGSTPPGAQYPFGFVRLSPDTAEDNIVLSWRHFGGYYYGKRHQSRPNCSQILISLKLL